MTPTAEVAIGSDIRSEQIVVTRPKRSEVVKAIRWEAWTAGVVCSRRQANELVNMLQGAVDHIRHAGYGHVYHIQDRHLDRLHAILEVVMPDDVAEPRAGSAHDRINRHLIRGQEFAVVHTRSRGYDTVEYCAVAIAVHSI